MNKLRKIDAQNTNSKINFINFCFISYWIYTCQRPSWVVIEIVEVLIISLLECKQIKGRFIILFMA